MTRFDDERVIAFKDPDGLLLELVAHPRVEGVAPPAPFAGATVPREHSHARRLLGDALARGLEQDRELFTEHLGFRAAREQGSIYRYTSNDLQPGGIVDLRIVPGLWQGTMGAGVVHHVAFRASDDAAQHDAAESLVAEGFDVTPQLDRDYFRSVYFREPGGVLLEIATDIPGFAVDEPADSLGRALKLPATLEPRRFEIEALLPNIHLPLDLPGPNA